MSTRRSRPPRGRKARNSEVPQNDVLVAPRARDVLDAMAREAPAGTVAEELAALEAGWDELLA